MMHYKKWLCAALALVMLLCSGGVAFAEEASAAGDLPDVDITSWEFILANQHNSIGVYGPEEVSYFYGQGVDSRIYDDAVEMIETCRTEGYPCYIVCAYRNWEYCLNSAQTITRLVYDNDPVAYATNDTAPGCNDHQTGLGFDITANPSCADNYDAIRCPIDDFDPSSPAWAWLKEHCAEYGFIVRYPEGKEQYYGSACNPTHLRYVGKEAAKYIMDNNLCLEEFLMLYGVHVNLPASK